MSRASRPLRAVPGGGSALNESAGVASCAITVDLARSDAAVRVASRGSHRASRRRADYVLVFALCAGPGVHCAGTAQIGPDRIPVIIGRFASAIEPAIA